MPVPPSSTRLVRAAISPLTSSAKSYPLAASTMPSDTATTQRPRRP
jgi:hypothetical protein